MSVIFFRGSLGFSGACFVLAILAVVGVGLYGGRVGEKFVFGFSVVRAVTGYLWVVEFERGVGFSVISR